MTESLLSKGHEKIFLNIKKLFIKNTLPHALLLSGPKSIGKSLFAKDIASLMLCSSQDKPCGSCKNCLFIKRNEHPDVIYHDCNEHPDPHSIRSLLSSLALKPFQGEQRITLLIDAEELSTQSSNILLKSLEEPPHGSYFILTSSAPSKLLRTITSRCQSIQLSPLTKETVTDILTTHGMSQSLDEYFDGTLQILSMSESEYALSGDLLRLLLKAKEKDYYALSEILALLPKDKIQLKNILSLLRNSIRNKMISGAYELEPLLTNLIESERLIFERNLNPQTVFAALTGLFVDDNPITCYISENLEGAE